MKRIDPEERTCEQCRKPMPRVRWANGRIERPADYRRRRFCERACRDLARRRAVRATAIRCLFCREALRRKRWACGKLEYVSEFRRRKFCNFDHMRQWLDDPLNRMEYAMWINAGIERRTSAPVCFHGLLAGVGCDWCAEMIRVTKATERHKDVVSLFVKTPAKWQEQMPGWAA